MNTRGQAPLFRFTGQPQGVALQTAHPKHFLTIISDVPFDKLRERQIQNIKGQTYGSAFTDSKPEILKGEPPFAPTTKILFTPKRHRMLRPFESFVNVKMGRHMGLHLQTANIKILIGEPPFTPTTTNIVQSKQGRHVGLPLQNPYTSYLVPILKPRQSRSFFLCHFVTL